MKWLATDSFISTECTIIRNLFVLRPPCILERQGRTAPSLRFSYASTIIVYKEEPLLSKKESGEKSCHIVAKNRAVMLHCRRADNWKPTTKQCLILRKSLGRSKRCRRMLWKMQVHIYPVMCSFKRRISTMKGK